MNKETKEQLRLSNIIDAIKKRWIIIAAVTLTMTLICTIYTFFIIKPTYEASTKVFIGKEESDEAGYNSNDIAMYQKLLKTYSEAIRTKDLVGRAIKELSYDIEAKTIIGSLTAAPVADTQIMKVSYRGGEPQEVLDILKNVTEEFIQTSKELVPNGNVKIIEEAELPEGPVSPNKKLNIILAFLFGLTFSLGIVFLLEYIDNTYKNKEQLEKDLDIPVLGIIPDIGEF